MTWRELGDDPVQRRVIDSLAAARLVTVDDDRVEITHESLIHGWPLLDGWIEQAREDLRTRARILRAAEEWDGQDRNPALLYRGSPLEAASVWAADHPGDLGPLETDFVAASDAAQRAEIDADEREQRSRRRVRRAAVSALAVLAVAAVVASAAAFVALQRSQANEEKARDRAARLLGTQAAAGSGADPLLGLALAAESIARSDRPAVDARRGLVASRMQLAETVGPVPLGAPFPVGDARTLAVTPRGDLVATGSRTGSINLWDAITGESRGVLSAPEGGIQDLAVDPQGRWLIAGDDDGRVWRWDVRSPGEPPTEPYVDLGEEQRNNVIWSVAYSPDGELIALGTEFSGVVLVDPATGEERTIPGTRGGADFLSVAFSPDGDRLVAGMGTGEVRVLSVASGDELGSVRAHPDDDVWELAFDHTGGRLVTGSSDGTARVWDAESLEPVGDPLRTRDSENSSGLDGLVLSGDGQVLYAGSGNGTVRTFDLTSGAEREVTGLGHSEEVIAAGASSDGSWLFTLGDDEQVRRWTLRAHRPVGTFVGSLPGPAAGIAVDPTARRVAVSDWEGKVHTFLLDSGARAQPGPVLAGHEGSSFGLAFVREGGLVTGDGAGALRRWDVVSGRELVERSRAHGAQIMGVAASPDGAAVATVSDDGTARVWDAERLTPRTPLLRTGPPTKGGDVAFTPDGERIVVASGGTVSVWTLDGEKVDSVAAGGRIWGVAVSPDGTQVATASADAAVSLRPLDDLETVDHRLGHSGPAADVAYSADGETVVTTTQLGEVRLWDAESGELLGEPFAAQADRIGKIWRVAFHSGSSHIWFAGDDGKVRESDVLDAAAACEITEGVPDARQRDRYLDGEEPVACRS